MAEENKPQDTPELDHPIVPGNCAQAGCGKPLAATMWYEGDNGSHWCHEHFTVAQATSIPKEVRDIPWYGTHDVGEWTVVDRQALYRRLLLKSRAEGSEPYAAHREAYMLATTGSPDARTTHLVDAYATGFMAAMESVGAITQPVYGDLPLIPDSPDALSLQDLPESHPIPESKVPDGGHILETPAWTPGVGQ